MRPGERWKHVEGMAGAARASKPVQVQVHIEVRLAKVFAEKASELMIYLAGPHRSGGSREFGRVTNGQGRNASVLAQKAVLKTYAAIADAGGMDGGIVLKAVAAKTQFEIARESELEQTLNLLKAGSRRDTLFNLKHAALGGVGRVRNRRAVRHCGDLI